MKQYQENDYALAKMLLERVKAKKERSPRITYGACADQLTAILGRKVNAHLGLSVPLGHVCEMCYECGVPFLTAIVVYKNDLQNSKTGEGFYKIACKLRKEYTSMDPIEAWGAEYYSVQKWKDWSSLEAYFASHKSNKLRF